MKVTVRKTSLRWLFQWTRRLLFTVAILMLGYCGYVLTDTWMFQRRESQNLDRMLHERRSRDQRQTGVDLLPAKGSASRAPAVPSNSRPGIGNFGTGAPAGLLASQETGVPMLASQKTGGPMILGRIEILRLGVSAVVVEGSGDPVLRRAVGHIPGTTLPGSPGNVGIAGHRDTFFRPLRNIRRDDIITLTTLGGAYRYRVVSIKITGPDDVAVLNPGVNPDGNGNEVLTLVTCFPFNFVGSAPRRFIVLADRIT